MYIHLAEPENGSLCSELKPWVANAFKCEKHKSTCLHVLYDVFVEFSYKLYYWNLDDTGSLYINKLFYFIS